MPHTRPGPNKKRSVFREILQSRCRGRSSAFSLVLLTTAEEAH